MLYTCQTFAEFVMGEAKRRVTFYDLSPKLQARKLNLPR